MIDIDFEIVSISKMKDSLNTPIFTEFADAIFVCKI